MTLVEIRTAGLTTLDAHGPMLPNALADRARIPRHKLGAFFGWAVWRALVKRDGRRYAILPDGRDWLRQQGCAPRGRPPTTGPWRVFVC